MRPNPAVINDENPEWTKEEWSRAIRGTDFFTPEQLTAIQDTQAKMLEKRLIDETSRKRITLTLDETVITHFKSTGKGWQKRINDALREKILA